LPQSNNPELLTRDRIYPLALVRERAARGVAQQAFDPQALALESDRFGVADFARFRQEFLAHPSAASTALQDPSSRFLDLLRRLLTIDYVRRNVAFHHNIKKLVQELVQGENSGLGRIDVDRIEQASLKAGQRLAEEVAQFRDRLDETKASLNLSAARGRAPEPSEPRGV
jgi:hypothetical protein